MICNLGIYNHVICILKFDIDTFTEKRENSEKYKYSLHTKLLQKCYSFLTKFVIDNFENQQIIQVYLQNVYLIHINTYPEIGFSFFIENLFKNNRILLSNSLIIHDALQSIVLAIDNIDISNPLKTHYLDCIKVFTKCKDKIFKQNQTWIINEISKRE